MDEQYGIFCTENEWLGVMAAVSRGILALKDESDVEGQAAKKIESWATHCCAVFLQRVRSEIGMDNVLDAKQ